jgi:tetratricopeptide (TPR) repeat protein
VRTASLRAPAFLLALAGAAGCAAPQIQPDAVDSRQRETRILLDVERSRRIDEAAVRRLSDEGRRKGRDLVTTAETEARNRSIELYRSLVTQYPSTRNDFMAEASFRLAELLFEAERERIRILLEEMGPATEVEAEFGKAIEAYRRVTELFPRHSLAEDAYYGLAYCYTEQGEPDQAAENYARLIELYPDTRYAAEIHMRLGEYLFSLGKLDAAGEHYRKVVEKGNAEYVEKALYKLGWCSYNQDRFEEALDHFFRLFDQIPDRRIEAGSLVRESLDIAARCFAESGGTPALARRLTRREADAFGPALTARLADLYKDRSLYPEAAGTYRLYLQNYPAGEDLPRVLANLRECYSIRGDALTALDVAESMPRQLGPGSPWHQAASPESRARALESVRTLLEESADQRRARAQAGGSRGELTKALADLVAAEGLGEKAPPCRVLYVKGLLLSELGETEQGARAWMALALSGECGDWAQRAALEAVDLLIRASDPGPVSLPLVGEAVALASRVSPADPRIPRAVLALGQICANAGSPAGARTQYSILLRQHQGTPEADRTRTLMARTFFQAGDYPQASAWFREAWKKSTDPEQAAEARKLLAYSLFKEAEGKAAAGNQKGAAGSFEALSREFPDSDVAQIALYNAGKLFREAGMEMKATELFEHLAIRYTESGYAVEALETSVKILETLGDLLRAAGDALLLAERTTGDDRPAALARAADLFAAGNAHDRAASTRAVLLSRFPSPPERAARQSYLMGTNWSSAGNWPRSQAAYRKAIDLAKAKESSEEVRRYAALSQLKLAEEAGNRYAAFSLAQPLEKSMEKKRALLSETVASLVAAGNYKIAEVSTAANFQIGAALEHFSSAILKSPRPPGLTEVEREEYDAQLAELAFPFEEKARRAYQVNLERAVALAFLDPWIVRSFERMADLAPWAYLREERVAYPATYLPPPPLSPPPPPDRETVKAALEETARAEAAASAGAGPGPAESRPAQAGSAP